MRDLLLNVRYSEPMLLNLKFPSDSISNSINQGTDFYCISHLFIMKKKKKVCYDF